MDALQDAAVRRAQAALELVGPGRKVDGRLAARFLQAKAATQNPVEAVDFIERARWLEAERLKAAVGSFGRENAQALLGVGADFMAVVRARSVVGRLLDRVRKLPVNAPTIRQLTGANASWVKEGENIGVQAGTFTREPALSPLKVAAISVVTQELAQASDAENIITRDLQAACADALDVAFCDPANAGSVGKKPASIFSGAPTVPSSGNSAADFKQGFRALLSAYKGSPDTAALICNTKTAIQIGLLNLDAVTIDVTGESRIVGLPAYFSDAVPRGDDGGTLGIVDLDRVSVVGLDQAELSISREASIQMSDSPTGGAAQMVPLFQTNSVALLAITHANWRVAPNSTAILTGCNYSGE